jgi:hypothetical protein
MTAADSESWRELRAILRDAHLDEHGTAQLFRRLRTDIADGYEKWSDKKDVDEYALAQRFFVDGKSDGIPANLLEEFRAALDRLAAVDTEAAEHLRLVRSLK